MRGGVGSCVNACIRFIEKGGILYINPKFSGQSSQYGKKHLTMYVFFYIEESENAGDSHEKNFPFSSFVL